MKGQLLTFQFPFNGRVSFLNSGSAHCHTRAAPCKTVYPYAAYSAKNKEQKCFWDAVSDTFLFPRWQSKIQFNVICVVYTKATADKFGEKTRFLINRVWPSKLPHCQHTAYCLRCGGLISDSLRRKLKWRKNKYRKCLDSHLRLAPWCILCQSQSQMKEGKLTPDTATLN